LLGAVATEGLLGSGLVHKGFYNLINGTPDDAEQDTSPMKVTRDMVERVAV
jgi:hypothetical protein